MKKNNKTVCKTVKTNTIKIAVCPECNSHHLYKDEIHLETYCYNCGLVVKAPFSTDFITPDLKIITLKIYDLLLS